MADTTKPQAATLTAELTQRAILKWSGARDNVGVARYEAWDGATFLKALAPSTRQFTTPPLTPGVHKLRLVTYDAAGNHANSNTVTITVPGEPPEPAPAPLTVSSRYNTLVLDEQFSGPTLDLTRWAPYSSPGDHARDAGIRDPSAFSIVDEQLVITAKWDAARGKIVTGGMSHRKDYLYGRFEARVRCEHDITRQMSAVVLTWPQSGVWPRDGENDFYETGRPNTGVKTFIHKPSLTHDQVYCDHRVSAQDWHTLMMDWEPERLRVFCDGNLSGEWTDPTLFPHVPHHVCPQWDVFGNGTTLPAPVRMFVDYIRIWQ